MRRTPLIEGEYYHVFNRGVDKRSIFEEEYDFDRFLTSMIEFNRIAPIGSLYEHSFRKKAQLGNLVPKLGKDDPLVEYVAYCLNPNHFHLIVKQCAEKGIQKLMHKLGLGYTNYFNEKYSRSGSLFQGTFKVVHIESDEQLIHLSTYVNLNNRVHGIKDDYCRSSWGEYIEKTEENICNSHLVLDQYRNTNEYRKMAEDTVEEIGRRREEMKSLLLE